MNHAAIREADYIMPAGERVHIRPLEKDDLPGLEWDGEYAHFRKLYHQHYENSLGGNTLIWVAVNADAEVIGQVFLLLLSRQRELADGSSKLTFFHFALNQNIGTRDWAALCLKWSKVFCGKEVSGF